jgi:hypothetical protein
LGSKRKHGALPGRANRRVSIKIRQREDLYFESSQSRPYCRRWSDVDLSHQWRFSQGVFQKASSSHHPRDARNLVSSIAKTNSKLAWTCLGMAHRRQVFRISRGCCFMWLPPARILNPWRRSILVCFCFRNETSDKLLEELQRFWKF